MKTQTKDASMWVLGIKTESKKKKKDIYILYLENFFSTMELFKFTFFFNCSHGKRFGVFCTPASSISFV